VDGTGFEPAASAMPTSQSFREKKLEIRLNTKIVPKFSEFMRVNMRLAPSTVKTSTEIATRFLKGAKYVVSYESTSDYLKSYLSKRPKTYNSQITGLRRFVRDFLGHPKLIMSFRMAPVDPAGKNVKLPSKSQLRKAFEVQCGNRAKAIYLFTATSGLRKGEILDLTKDKIDFKLRAVIPQHFTRVKRSGITFYNAEAEKWLDLYLTSRTDRDSRLFVISDRKWKEIWKNSSKAANVKITPKVLRVWFATEMGELGVPDRFVDVFQGRAPRSVLAKHYTGKGLQRLKRIYDKVGLKVLS
jgi:intergrase/recombinase